VEESIKPVRRLGKHPQGNICYTETPLHTHPGYVDMASELIDLC
jgi:methylmalonyl-CoA carboxyltransferase 5S subunit